MKKNWFFIGIAFLILISCEPKQNKTLITKKIQYDVSIKSPNPAYDSWIQNIEQSQREQFVNGLLDAAYSGRIPAYDYFNKPMSVEDLNKIGKDTTYRTLTRNSPPYQEYDTIIVSKIEISDIHKIRFLEEWSMDEQNLVFDKKVIGIAPVVDKFDDEGNFMGLLPMFWIYPNGIEALKK